MKSALAIAAALTLCGSAFATTTQHTHGVVATVKQDAHQIGSSFRTDMHRIARADKFRQEEAADKVAERRYATAMGAGPAPDHVARARQERMDAAYARWERTHR